MLVIFWIISSFGNVIRYFPSEEGHLAGCVPCTRGVGFLPRAVSTSPLRRLADSPQAQPVFTDQQWDFLSSCLCPRRAVGLASMETAGKGPCSSRNVTRFCFPAWKFVLTEHLCLSFQWTTGGVLTYPELYSHYRNSLSNVFINPKRNPIPFSSHSPFRPSQPLTTTNPLSVSGFACSGHFM